MLGISFDSVEDNARFAAAQGFPFPLLCDTDRSVALAYGAAESVSDAYPHRMTFVIDPEGLLEQVIETRNPGGQAAELLSQDRPSGTQP